MSEQMTITVRDDVARAIESAVARGEFQTSNDAVEWALSHLARALEEEKLATLRADIQLGLDDIKAGRARPFDRNEIIAAGRARLAARSL